MFLTFVLILVTFSFIYLYIFKYKYKYWERLGIPYSTPVFPYGNTILGKELHPGEQALRDYLKFKKQSPIFGGYRMVKPVIYVTSPELAKNILIKDFHSFYGRGMYENYRDDPLSAHLFNLSGPRWKKLREKLTPVFTTGKIKYMMPTLLKVGEDLVEVLTNEVKIESTIDMKEWIARFTTDIIGTTAFGLECNSLRDPDAEFRKQGKRVFAPTNPLKLLFAQNFPSFSRNVLHLSLRPKDLTKFFLKAVEDTVRYREENNIQRNDFMDLLIKIRNKDKSEDFDKDQDKKGFSLPELAAQAFIFFVAGFETSSTLTSYTLLELALNPELQTKARNHINEVLKKHNNELTYEALQDMTYIEQCMNESLRKYPTLALLFREATENYPLPNMDYTIKKGTFCLIPSYAFNHDPELWPEPSKFDPDRFENFTTAVAHEKAFYPFGDGPKNCIGERFGKIQTKLGLVMILKNFKMMKSEKTEFPVKFNTRSALLAPKNPIYIKLEKVSTLQVMIHGLLYIAAICVAIYYFIFKWRYKHWERHSIKYVEPKFPFGTVSYGGELHWGQIALRDYLKYKNDGPIYGGFQCLKPLIYVNDKTLAKNILIKDFNIFYDRGIYRNPHDDPINENLFIIGGPKWNKLRQSLTPVFTSGKIRNMLPMVTDIGKNLIEIVKDEIKIDPVLDMKEWVARFTTDVIGSCAFGLECNSLKDPNAKFREMGKRYLSDMSIIQALICVNFPTIALKLGMKFSPQHVTDFFIKVVEDTVKYREQNNVTRNDFMDLLIKMRNKDKSNSDKDAELEGLSMNEIAAQAFVFFFAGFETSSTVVSYTLIELAMNQEIQDKVRKEINEVLKKHGDEVTYEALQEMTYLDQCIYESMRKYPTLAILQREASQDYPIPNTNLKIPKGTLTIIPSYAFNHDPEEWPEPSKFDPDRFTDMSSGFRQQKGFYPFGDGPKNCIGERFGKIQSKVGLVMLLKNFKFSKSPKTVFPVEFNTDFELLTVKGGIYLKVENLE
ncbi:uncharacterized protein LOC134829111 [Culicoides brevitarsis]|uniref:uncharacterized protein LOC134829111 n=1 Tax=Culicoides brevitarsis TaxID=469753 RepID=UPI00307BCC65